MGMLILAAIVLAAAGTWSAISRFAPRFRILIRNGHVVSSGGAIPPRFLSECEELAQLHQIKHLVVSASLADARQISIRGASAQEHGQFVRNVWAATR